MEHVAPDRTGVPSRHHVAQVAAVVLAVAIVAVDLAIGHILHAAVHAVLLAALVAVLVTEWRVAVTDERESRAVLADLRTTQAMLIQAEKLESIGQLAAGIAHEINTPVQYVTDNSTFLESAFDDLLRAFDELEALARVTDTGRVDDVVREADITFLREEIPLALAQSHEGLARVSEIVRAMKDFSHPGSEVAAADLNHAIESTVTVSRNEWKYVAAVEVQLDPTLPAVRCHEGQIKQVVLNMVVNAAHAIGEAGHDPSTGRIVVTTGWDGDRARISVSDNGCGMPPEVRARIFDPFFTTKEVGRGTGQGLSVAHRIVGAHAGRILVDSTQGVGTTFTLDLPVDGPAAEADADAGDADVAAGELVQ